MDYSKTWFKLKRKKTWQLNYPLADRIWQLRSNFHPAITFLNTWCFKQTLCIPPYNPGGKCISQDSLLCPRLKNKVSLVWDLGHFLHVNFWINQDLRNGLLYWEKNSLCLKKKKRKKENFVGKICGVLKDDLKTNIPIALEAKHWPVFSLLLIYFIFELRLNSTLIQQGVKQLAGSKSAPNL